MPIKDSQYCEGAADSEEDNSSWSSTGDCWQSTHGMYSSDGLILGFPLEHRKHGLPKHQTSRRTLKSAETKSEASSNLLQSLSLSLRSLKLHGVVEGKASSDDDCDDYVSDDGMDDSIHLTKRRFNRHNDDIIPENDVCKEHERDAAVMSKSGGIEHQRNINAALPELQQQTMRATAA